MKIQKKCKSKDLKVYALEGLCAQVPRLPTETRYSVENIPCFDMRVLKYHACQQIKRVEGSRFGGSECSSTAPANKSKING